MKSLAAVSRSEVKLLRKGLDPSQTFRARAHPPLKTRAKKWGRVRKIGKAGE
jgi:hypothetical protein